MAAAPSLPRQRGRRQTRSRRARRLIETFPGALGLTFVVVLIGVLLATVLRPHYDWILNHIGTDIDSLKRGRVWTMPIATITQAETGIKWHQALFVLLFVGALEYQVGALRAIVTFFVSDWLSSVLTVGVLEGLSRLGSASAERLVHTPDMGSSAAAVGAAGAAAALLPRPWREAAVAILIAVVIFTFTFEGLDVSIAHLIAACAGAALGLFAWRGHRLRTIPLPEIRLGRSRASQKIR